MLLVPKPAVMALMPRVLGSRTTMTGPPRNAPPSGTAPCICTSCVPPCAQVAKKTSHNVANPCAALFMDLAAQAAPNPDLVQALKRSLNIRNPVRKQRLEHWLHRAVQSYGQAAVAASVQEVLELVVTRCVRGAVCVWGMASRHGFALGDQRWSGRMGSSLGPSGVGGAAGGAVSRDGFVEASV